jgi:UDP-N-acetylmuramyl pentapeptide phosphotransferase/UDP-N-acetylglucosamine-1-phosphate transferase
MKTNRITYALITVAALAAIVALAALTGFDGLIGYGTVIALIALAAAEYRLNPRRVFGNK